MSFNAKELKEKYNPDGSVTYRMQQRMLEILKVVDAICRKHNIPYWLCGGTMIGAIRHKGFIPWDDDLDIDMLRPDFERFVKLLPSELPDNLALQWHTTDKNYFFQYAKIRDRNSEMYEHNGYDRIWREHGVWIDVFPLERMPKWVHRMSNLPIGHCYKILRTADDPAKVAWKVRWIAAVSRNAIFPVLRAVARLSGYRYYDFAMGIPYYRRSAWSDIFPVRYEQFEDMQAPVMHEAEKSLTERFGNFMELPENPPVNSHSGNVKIW